MDVVQIELERFFACRRHVGASILIQDAIGEPEHDLLMLDLLLHDQRTVAGLEPMDLDRFAQ